MVRCKNSDIPPFFSQIHIVVIVVDVFEQKNPKKHNGFLHLLGKIHIVRTEYRVYSYFLPLFEESAHSHTSTTVLKFRVQKQHTKNAGADRSKKIQVGSPINHSLHALHTYASQCHKIPTAYTLTRTSFSTKGSSLLIL